MLTIRTRSASRADLPCRRGFLRAGALGALSLADVLRARAAQPAEARRDTAVILYWMAGGPSHIDTYDPKPDAPAEVRGPFRTVPTRVPGLRICELLPRQAAIAEKWSLVRSLHHGLSVHDDASHWVQTGYPLVNARARGQQHPAQGAVVSHLRGPNAPGLPAYVCIPDAYNSARGFYQSAAFLGAEHGPINAGGDPSLRKYRAPDLALPAELSLGRLQSRRDLLSRLDGLARRAEDNSALREMDPHYRRAFELLTGPRAREAFDLSKEPPSLKDRYGHNPWGRSALLARRLVEAGVTFVTVNHYEADVDWWDDHVAIEKNLRRRLPPFDQALAALIADLHDRGLSKRVLVVACGEFGRGPKIDKQAGRGHWPRAMSALLSGGGLRGGQVVGATTADGGEPRERPLGPGDLLATVYRVLGIDPDQTVTDRQLRPVRLVESGEPIAELF